ncbi:MAG: cytochrome c peroxidase [Planctomycetota bacterium]|nr:cytochrome c peroxidase [Planctomycetota bacterium]
MPVSFHHNLFVVSLLTVCATAEAQLIGRWPVPAFPPGNPTSASGLDPLAGRREALGKMLFWDEQLSHDRTMACGSCHAMEFGGNDKNGGVQNAGFNGVFGDADDNFGSPGVVRQDINGDYFADPLFGVERQPTLLNAPTMIGAAFFDKLFWDKRAGPNLHNEDGTPDPDPGFQNNAALEDQAAGPPISSVEMGHDGIVWSEIEQKLGAMQPLALAVSIPPTFPVVTNTNYQRFFDIAFGPGPITRKNVAIALAAYMRTLVPDQAPVDLGTMTPDQVAGLNLFRTRGCATCHSNGGTIQFNAVTQTFPDANDLLFSDGRAHNIRLDDHDFFPPGFPNDGFGRGVKTPTLRNVGLRKRLFHSGHMTSLTQAMEEQYNHPSTGVTFRFNPLLSTVSPGPGLKSEFDQALDFLENALTDPRVVAGLPPFDSPVLRGDVAPFGHNLVGPGSVGTGGLVPQMIANAPPKIGNDDFKFGLGDALVGAPALLFFSRGLTPGQLINGIPLELDRNTMVRIGTFPVGPTGTTTFWTSIPDSTLLIGEEIDWQWFVLDPANPSGVAASAAARHIFF